MPLYEYKCDSCGDVFEVIQKFSDRPLTVHDKCGGTLERLVSTSALQFKGSGWYVNDYGKGNSKEPKPKVDSSNGAGSEKSNGTGPAESSGKSEGKSDKTTKTDSPSTTSTPSSSKSDSK